MAPLRGWAPRGERRIGRAPHGHWRIMTFIAVLRHNRVDAPFVLDGPGNGEAFRACVEQVLAPTLQPGDLPAAGRWGMDNLASHKGQAVQKAIRNAKARLLCLPPYSPDLNPIEQGRAKLKHMLRDAAERTMQDRAQDRRPARTLHPERMPKLHGQCRTRFNLISSRSISPASFRVIRQRRCSKYICSGCDHTAQAPAPGLPIARGKPDPGLLAHLLVSKYGDHLPLYRQSRIYEREGVRLPRASLAGGKAGYGLM